MSVSPSPSASRRSPRPLSPRPSHRSPKKCLWSRKSTESRAAGDVVVHWNGWVLRAHHRSTPRPAIGGFGERPPTPTLARIIALPLPLPLPRPLPLARPAHRPAHGCDGCDGCDGCPPARWLHPLHPDHASRRSCFQAESRWTASTPIFAGASWVPPRVQSLSPCACIHKHYIHMPPIAIPPNSLCTHCLSPPQHTHTHIPNRRRGRATICSAPTPSHALCIGPSLATTPYMYSLHTRHSLRWGSPINPAIPRQLAHSRFSLLH